MHTGPPWSVLREVAVRSHYPWQGQIFPSLTSSSQRHIGMRDMKVCNSRNIRSLPRISDSEVVFRRLFPQLPVVAFEASAVNFALLAANWAALLEPGLRCANGAVVADGLLGVHAAVRVVCMLGRFRFGSFEKR